MSEIAFETVIINKDVQVLTELQTFNGYVRSAGLKEELLCLLLLIVALCFAGKTWKEYYETVIDVMLKECIMEHIET